MSELSHFDDKPIAITATQEVLTSDDDDEDMFREFRQRKPTVSSLDNSVQNEVTKFMAMGRAITNSIVY